MDSRGSRVIRGSKGAGIIRDSRSSSVCRVSKGRRNATVGRVALVELVRAEDIVQ